MMAPAEPAFRYARPGRAYRLFAHFCGCNYLGYATYHSADSSNYGVRFAFLIQYL
jgi:hypothetical protein